MTSTSLPYPSYRTPEQTRVMGDQHMRKTALIAGAVFAAVPGFLMGLAHGEFRIQIDFVEGGVAAAVAYGALMGLKKWKERRSAQA